MIRPFQWGKHQQKVLGKLHTQMPKNKTEFFTYYHTQKLAQNGSKT